MLINTNDSHPIETTRIIDQDLPAFGQGGAVRSIPRYPQALGNPGDRQMLAHDSFQRPAKPAAGEPARGSAALTRLAATHARIRCTGSGGR